MIKALTLETFLSLAAVSLHTIADDQISCQTRIESNLLNSWERQLYDYYPEMFVSIVRCDQNFYDFFIGAMHEGLHALDTDLKAAQEMMLQIESGNLEYDPSFIENNIKIHTQSGYVLSLPRFNNDLPTPKDLLNPYFLNPSIQKSEQFESFFYEYVEDDEAMSSGSFSAGFFLEWSAYLHGLKSSLLRKEQLIRPIGQGEGLIFFIIITEIYLNQLEINHQEEFLSIKRSDEALELLRVLDSESKEVLQSFDYCSEYSADHSVLKTLNDITKTDTLKRLTEAEFTSNELLRDYLEN